MQRKRFRHSSKAFLRGVNPESLEYELFDGNCHTVFADGGQDVIGDGFEGVNGIPHGEAKPSPFDHFEVICLVTDGHHGIAWNIELTGQLRECDAFVDA